MRLATSIALALMSVACPNTDPGSGDVAADLPADIDQADAEPETSPPGEPRIEGFTVVVPGDHLPVQVQTGLANNNLDIVRHSGRIFLAFRTGESHFASEHVRLWVLSTDDEVTWRYEGGFDLQRDLREPRFLSWNGELFLYFAVLGTNPVDFEPHETRMARYLGPGQWGESTAAIGWPGQPEDYEGFIPWRTKVVDGVPYMLGYVGGGEIYNATGELTEGLEISWLTTTDGVNWTPVVPQQPVVSIGGGSETDFEFTDDGAVIAVTRNERGDDTGYGSKICRAEPAAIGTWDCVNDPRKFDSPLVFKHGSKIMLIARRQVTESGWYDLTQLPDADPDLTLTDLLIAYSTTPKRCAVWEVDPTSLEVTHVLDLPSAGDTCFPGMVPLDAHHYLVYNYSSDPEDPDRTWIDGQVNPTFIHRMVLALP